MLCGLAAGAQQLPAVRGIAGTGLENAWAGGMNSCQFGMTRLDSDELKDLVVFDRFGDRIMTFVNQGGLEYQYRPEYAAFFPELTQWMILSDYNGDGKEDIFTYAGDFPGIVVYKNISGSQPAFEQVVAPYLTSLQGGIYTNILVTYADYPGIGDLDGDGDLDILVFWGLGAFVEMHRNLSMEKYGIPDSLDFEKMDYCWGYFAESEESNELTLDTCIGWRPEIGPQSRFPHTGSTFLLTDLQGDGVSDVVLGDVDYPNLIALYNDGTADSAHISHYDPAFPSNDTPVHLFSMPAAAHLDLDNDGIKDLLVSPFDPNPVISENRFSSWLYLNEGSGEVPVFRLDDEDFLQEGMIDVGAGAYPAMADYNLDGLNDLFIGNYGLYDSSYYDQYMILHTVQTSRISLFVNTGSATAPSFTLADADFASMAPLGLTGLVPAFGDLDGDGDADMLCGQANGRLLLFENTAPEGGEMQMEWVTDEFQGIDAGEYSAPFLTDLDQDGVTDLVIGEKGGSLYYYKGSEGDQWANFSLVSENLGEVNVTNPAVSLDGYSVPFFFRDMEGNTLLLVGSEDGQVFFYNDIDGNLSGKFSESDTLGFLIGQEAWDPDRGYRTAALVADLDGDLRPEMLAGNWSGGLEYFSRTAAPPVSGVDNERPSADWVSLFPNPAKDAIFLRISQEHPYRLYHIMVYNILGEKVLEDYPEDPGRAELKLGHLPGGYYSMRVIIRTQNGRLDIINKNLILFN